jgi:hypothetical protein
MSRRLLLLGGLLLLAACSEDRQLDMDRATSEIDRSLEATYDLDVGDVSCPDSVAAEDGTVFTCAVSIGGQPLTVDVHQQGDDGELRVVPTAAVLPVAEVQADLVEQLADRLDDPDARADCGPDAVRVVVPDRSFECEVTDGDTTRAVVVPVRDVDGSLTYRLR